MGDKLRFNDEDHGGLYEPTDSEDNYSEEEKELLQKVRQGNRRKQDPKQELLAFDGSDDDEDEEAEDGDDVGELMEDSDIEGAAVDDDANIPDSKAWGRKTRDYYNTDFVDPDYSSYTEKELEMAQHEEEAALAIQQRLAQQMNEADFNLDIPTTGGVESGSENDGEKGADDLENFTKLKTDLSGLSKRQKLQFFEKDSPEFSGLVEDLLLRLSECSKLLNPVLEYATERKLPRIPALEFAQLMRTMLTTYCSNINFYLMLKANRTPIKHHPVVKRLVQFKNMLEELSDRYDNIIKPQLEALLERIEDGDEFEVLLPKSTQEMSLKKKSRNTAEAPESKRVKIGDKHADSAEDFKLDGSTDDDEEEEEGDDDDEDEEGALDEAARRGITYQMAKNKGLTPHRRKELRNPRVKHRSKFRKALIRRKGAVRTVRKETKRYGGEVSGIKATVSKSVKFK